MNFSGRKFAGIIAECGNNHLGNLKKAKEMINAAKESGVAAVKFQIIDPETAAHHGSMPLSFYKACALDDFEYMELFHYGIDVGILVFFSIFGRNLPQELNSFIVPYKISGGQFLSWEPNSLAYWNSPMTVLSIPKVENAFLEERKDCISKMQLLYVSPYLEKPNWGTLIRFRNFFGPDREIGLSDHSVGIEECVTAIRDYDCKLIEKHFSLGEDIVWEGKLFRDSVHSCNPKQMETLVKIWEDHHGNA
jgi:sialic acid synthase SpsE